MRTRKILLGLVATAAIASPIAMAASADAAVTVDKGIGHVDKGDIQSSSVLDMNNAKFQTAAEKGQITFTANVENIVDYKMTCLGSAEFGHRVIHQPVRYNLNATPVLNGAATRSSASTSTPRSVRRSAPGPPGWRPSRARTVLRCGATPVSRSPPTASPVVCK